MNVTYNPTERSGFIYDQSCEPPKIEFEPIEIKPYPEDNDTKERAVSMQNIFPLSREIIYLMGAIGFGAIVGSLLKNIVWLFTY